VRRWYGLFVTGYVVMPEHVHLLISEPERSSLRVAIQMLKQITALKLRPILSPKKGRRWGTRHTNLTFTQSACR
jgi:REP element-mobilizing transposase RayT